MLREISRNPDYLLAMSAGYILGNAFDDFGRLTTVHRISTPALTQSHSGISHDIIIARPYG